MDKLVLSHRETHFIVSYFFLF